jgi:hypothetical protein
MMDDVLKQDLTQGATIEDAWYKNVTGIQQLFKTRLVADCNHRQDICTTINSSMHE